MRPRLGVGAPRGPGAARPIAIRSARSSQRTIAGHASRSTCGSPYSWYSSHGTSTIASPQPAEPLRVAMKPVRSAAGIGAMLQRVPSSHCVATRSRSHFREKPSTS